MVLEISKNKTVYILHRVSSLDIALSIRHLSIMLKSGLALEDALAVLSRQSPDPKLQEAYGVILKDVRSGISTATSMKKMQDIFSPIVISIIEVGEKGGTLEKNLDFLSSYLKKAYELQKKVKGALIYPAIVLCLTFVEMIGVMFFIVPQMESLFNSFDELPKMTELLLKSSQFFRANAVFLGIGLVLFIVITLRGLKTKPGKKFKDWLALHFPVFKVLNKKNTLATFSRTLGILLESGIPLADALTISATTVDNSYFLEVFKVIRAAVEGGKSIAGTMESFPEFFPAMFVKMVEVGEQTGSLEDNLAYLYEFYSADVAEMSDNMSTLLEPLLIIFIGAMIGVLAISIVGPIYQLTGSINQV